MFKWAMERQFWISVEFSHGPWFLATSPDIKTSKTITEENSKLKIESHTNEWITLLKQDAWNFSPNNNKHRTVNNDKCLKTTHFKVRLDQLLNVPIDILHAVTSLPIGK